MLLKNDPRRNNTRAAFTLMEMLVVVAIIVVLAGLGGYYVLNQLASSRVSAAKIKMKELTKACENYAIDHNGRFPTTLAELKAISPEGKGPYLKATEDLISPFGTQYVMDPSGPNNAGQAPDIYCLYSDGKTTIGNWMK